MNEKTFPTHPPKLRVASRGITMSARNCVRVYRNSPEAIALQVRMENRYVTVSLTFDQARDIGLHLQAEAAEEKKPVSWRPEVQTGSDPNWYGNALRFATKEEAQDSARELMSRWMAVYNTRATESDEPVNTRFDGEARRNVAVP